MTSSTSPVSPETIASASGAPSVGQTMLDRVRQFYPICRSLTGPGNRQTLALLAQSAPELDIHEIPSGTPVLDWVIPPEWTLREAWIRDPSGNRIVDFRNHNLHLVGYSVPVRRTIGRAELLEHLHSLPEHPDWIPYRTSYYNETWGFCVPDRLKTALPDGRYEVCVDADLAPGHLTYGEAVLPGETPEEFLFSIHICHPSLANDNLSGLVVAEQLMRRLRDMPRHRYTYRFLFIPGTIGSIAWLALNPEAVRRIRHGLVLSCLGDPGWPHYKRSREGHAPIDRIAAEALRHNAPRHTILDFVPYGYDERQYGSPGFNLPVGLLTRTPHGAFPEYHTSADDPDFLDPDALADSLQLLLAMVRMAEEDGRYRNTHPMGEPQLGRRGLYDSLGGENDRKEAQLALLWVLNQADGTRTLLDIATRSGLPWPRVREAADRLLAHGLLEDIEDDTHSHA